LQTETATQSRARPDIEEVTTGSVLLCAIRREVAQISNAFDTCIAGRWKIRGAFQKRMPGLAGQITVVKETRPR
ncbi:hypothetical protein, partial [Burkholderia vietnamiensis]